MPNFGLNRPTPAGTPGNITYSTSDIDPQRPFDAAVVIQTLLRDTLPQALDSIYAQDLEGFIQILVGIDDPKADRSGLYEKIDAAPANVAVTVLDPGYSTFASNGGLHPAYGGVLRTVLSYAANSRYVAYLDDDNWWAPDHISTLLAAIEDYDWAFSLRVFADPDTQALLAIDDQESVGPGGGIFNKKFGGFVDTSSLMIDKLACEAALRLWSVPLQADGKGEDRIVFDLLKRNHPFNCTFKPTSYYAIDRRDPIHHTRGPFIDSVSDRFKSGESQTVQLSHLPERIRQSCRDWVLNNLPSQGVGAEIGVWKGDFSALLLKHAKPRTLHLIDPWIHRETSDYDLALYGERGKKGQKFADEVFDGVCNRFAPQIAKGNVVIHRKTSMEAAATLENESLDWVYIDGDHHYEQVLADLRAYLPKLKTNGWMVGADPNEDGWWGDDVRRALEAFLYGGGVEFIRIAGNQFVLKKRAKAPPEPMNPSLRCHRGPVALSVKDRFRQDPFAIVAPHDFRFAVEQSIGVDDLRQRKELSLYCLDDRNRQFLFVETPDVNALETAPFMYQEQFQQATRLYAVPYECLRDLAAPMYSSPVFILSTGRVDSTLLSKLFGTIPEARSFSEPDVFTQISNLRRAETRNAAKKRDAELVELITLATQSLLPAGSAQPQRQLVIKHRSMTSALADLFAEAFPDARFIFLHRSPESWARSAVRASGYTAEQLCWLWQSGSEGYRQLREAGVRLLSVSYEDLCDDSAATFARVLDFCGLEAPATGIDDILKRDSQAGTALEKTMLDRKDRDVEESVRGFLAAIADSRAAFQE